MNLYYLNYLIYLYMSIMLPATYQLALSSVICNIYNVTIYMYILTPNGFTPNICFRMSFDVRMFAYVCGRSSMQCNDTFILMLSYCVYGCSAIYFSYRTNNAQLVLVER